MSDKNGLSAPVASAPSRRVSQGPVMPIGGAEETEPGGEILERFIDLAGGKKARIAIIPTASDDPQRSGEGYAHARSARSGRRRPIGCGLSGVRMPTPSRPWRC